MSYQDYQQYPEQRPSNGLGTAALVLGIVGVLLSLIPGIGIIAWPVVIVGIILGILGIRKVSQGRATNKKSAIVGTVLSGVGLVICVLWVVFTLSVFQSPEFQNEFEQEMSRQMESN
ncbi:hypothetical protein SAMN04487905_102285 [Actinopolyspora xinjiangensis]|uniref:DUF4190 domain-containing protein n=1 Tax=Actinopolyspora xinjiangensis TaxID=405564 RepID=A0A1H0QLC5_9ACTN|nr:DUF4190 domain-containing protein [Actinopolyspora xinjiangensis]SDP18000.1 hypothetical protein SAMN04487905_102285 [Actinopolyspora xinjiangensis]